MKNLLKTALVLGALICSNLFSMQIPYIQQIEVVQHDVDATVPVQININSEDPISKDSFKELTEERMKKKVPLLIIQIHTQEGDKDYYHYFDYANLNNILKTGQNPINRQPINYSDIAIYYIFSTEDLYFHYLTGLVQKLIPANFTGHLQMMIDASAPITVEDFIKLFDENWQYASEHQKKAMANFTLNYFAHYPEFAIEIWQGPRNILRQLIANASAFHSLFLKNLILKNAPDNLLRTLGSSMRDIVNEKTKKEIQQLALSKGKPDPFVVEQGFGEIYPPAVPTLIITAEPIQAGNFINKVNLEYEDPTTSETLEALIKTSKANKNPFVLAKVITKQDNKEFQHVYDATAFLKGDISRNLDDGTFRDPMTNLFGRIYYYYIFDPEDGSFKYVTDGNFDHRNGAFDIFIKRILDYLIYNPTHLTTAPSVQDPIYQELSKKINELEQTTAEQSTGYEQRDILRLQRIRQNLIKYRLPFETYLAEALNKAYANLFDMPEEFQQKERERIANFLVNYFAHYPEYAINAYQKNFNDILDFLKNASEHYPKLIVELIKNRNAPDELINRLIDNIKGRIPENVRNGLLNLAQKNNRATVVTNLIVASIPVIPVIPIRPAADLNNLYNQLRTLLNQLQRLQVALARL